MLDHYDKDYLNYIERIWKEERNKSYFKSAFAINNLIFPHVIQCLLNCDDVAYISLIEGAYQRNISSAQSYINITLRDNVNNNDKFMGILDFIEKNIGKHFIICCEDGKKYSRGICKFIFNMFSETYAEGKINYYNPCIMIDTNVIVALKRAYIKKHHIY